MTMFRPRMRGITVAGVCLFALLAGCTMAPTYERPAAPMPTTYEAPTGSGVHLALADPLSADADWADVFTDADLQTLIRRALAQNRDLRLASLRVQEARALYGIESANLLPSVQAGGAFSRQRYSGSAGQPDGASNMPGGYVANDVRATVGVSAFELDFFGRVRSLRDAALQEYLSSEEAQRAAQVSLVAEVATSYIGLVAANEQIAYARDVLAAREDGIRVIRLRAERGLVDDLDLNTETTQVEVARAALAERERQRSEIVHALQVLTGDVGAKPAAASSLDGAFVVPVAAGLPSSLLMRRPDIRQAEAKLRGANANIGAARAAFFPSVRLTTDIGTASASFSDLFGAGTGVWSFMPQITVPIFSGGRNIQGLNLANVRKEMAVVSYERTIQTAFAEVDDALTAQQLLARQYQAQKRVSDGERERLRLAKRRYVNGVASYLELLDAQRSEFHAAQQLIDVKQRVLVNHVALYRALGGGWKPEDDAS
ncbi:efflux transporter outer membrane subunit [Pandoraea sputorum]|uniref:Outer membrane protein oprM n=1 Tax=Pandoraea sputorum TaxID=93222 RepID=A0A239SS70_9BURK|nr:efflux transporter outer membrane subunit [Pandoraea sputorum]AJC19216.2 multidrug transporter [Pandoraea sputorum]SNU87493.1 Outer membrane protein oprM precursor [Pandoraea sputorum]VVE50615.1 multidrug transporter [Pandoraea sputorum]